MIIPISGEIKSEPLNSNFSYLDSEKISKNELSYLNVRDYGALGDGETDDTIAIQAAIDDANSKNLPLEFENKQYLIQSVVLKSNTYLLQGAEFISNGPIAGNIYVIDCLDNVIADNIQVFIKSGSILDRVVCVRSKNIINNIIIESEVQHSDYDDSIDSCLVVNAVNATIGNIRINNFDYAISIYNSTGVSINDIRCENYVRGLYYRQSKNCRVNNMQIEGKSPNAGFIAGHNGLLIEDSEDLSFGDINIFDSGEHGIRIGGKRDGVYSQKRFYFGDIVVKRAGGCGFKSYSGASNPVIITTIHMNNLTTIDCSYKGSPSRNKDGLYLAGALDVKIGSFRCVTENETIAGYSGIYLSGVDKMNIESVDIQNVAQIGIAIDLAYGRVNDLYVNSSTLRNITNEGILIDHSTEVLRDVVFKNIYLRGYGTAYYGVKIVAGQVYQPVVFDGYVGVGTSLGAFNSNTSNTNIYNKLVSLA